MGRLDNLLQGAASLEGDEATPASLFFALSSQDAVLDELERLTEEAERLVAVFGGSGAGKSSLLYQLVQRAPAHWDIVRLDANPMLHPEPFLDLLARQIDIADREGDVQAEIQARFVARRLKGRVPVVVVDDAHLLPPESVGLLLDLQRRRDQDWPCVRFLLFAQPELNALLESGAMRKAFPEGVDGVRIPPLGRRETDHFVESFLGADGRSGRFAMSAAQVEQVFRVSGGLPGRIEEETLQMLSEGALGYRPQFGLPAIPLSLIAAGGILILILVGILLWPEAPGEEEEALAMPKTDAPAPAEILSSAPAGFSPSVPTGDSLPEPGPSAVVEREAEPEPGGAGSEPEEALASWEGLPLPPLSPLEKDRTRSPFASPFPAAELESQDSPEAEGADPVPTPDADEAPAPPVASDFESAPADSSSPEVPDAVTEAPPPAVQNQPLQASTPPGEDAVTPESPSTSGAALRREIWALAQDPDSFTLQLVASGNREGIEKFLRGLNLSGKIALIEANRDGRPWYSVLYGVYADRAAAQNAKAALPPSLQGAWPRSFRSVREELQ